MAAGLAGLEPHALLSASGATPISQPAPISATRPPPADLRCLTPSSALSCSHPAETSKAVYASCRAHRPRQLVRSSHLACDSGPPCARSAGDSPRRAGSGRQGCAAPRPTLTGRVLPLRAGGRRRDRLCVASCCCGEIRDRGAWRDGRAGWKAGDEDRGARTHSLRAPGARIRSAREQARFFVFLNE